MSDPDAPPPAPQPPPPPPPSLAPPPGYAEYTPNLSAAVPLKRIGGLRTALLVVLAVFVVGTIIQIAATPSIVDSAQDFVADRVSQDEFEDDLAAYSASGLLTGASQVAIIVLTMIWLYRIATNHRTLGRRLTWAPLWAIFGWFVPPVLFIIPLLMLRESWKAADPSVPPGDDRWRSSGESVLVWVWWVLYGLAPVVFLVVSFRLQFRMIGGSARDFAETIEDRLGLLVAQSIVTVLSAVAWALVVHRLTDRHRRLTGEAAR